MRIIKVCCDNVWGQKGFATSLLKTRSEVKVTVTLCSDSVVVKCSQMFVGMEPNLNLTHILNSKVPDSKVGTSGTFFSE